jgi:hypothetical protein
MSFYLHLPSNVSPQYFPTNRISSFKTKLPKRFKFLPCEYEVALMEFSYIHSIKTFPKEFDRTVEFLFELPDLQQTKGVRVLPNKNYTNLNILLKELNALMNTKDGTYANFVYNTTTKRVEFEPLIGALKLSGFLSQAIGFEGVTLFNNRTSIAKCPPDLSGGMYHIFIYSDIAQPQIVGDTFAPLLRLVNISGKEGEAITQTFRPFYIPLAHTEFDTIEILLCNEFGEEIQFDNGQSVITLHFKKLKNGN